MVCVLTHRVFSEFFMLACHMLVCSLLYCICLLLHASVPNHFLPSVSSLPLLAHIHPLAVGLASSFHPLFLSIQVSVPSVGPRAYRPIHADQPSPQMIHIFIYSFLCDWKPVKAVSFMLFRAVWLPLRLHNKRCFFYSEFLCVALLLCFFLLYIINLWFFSS